MRLSTTAPLDREYSVYIQRESTTVLSCGLLSFFLRTRATVPPRPQHLASPDNPFPSTPSFTMSNRTSRPKPAPPGNEEASATLNLGEFQNVDTLTLSEASLVLNALVAKRRNDRKNVNETEYAFGFDRTSGVNGNGDLLTGVRMLGC